MPLLRPYPLAYPTATLPGTTLLTDFSPEFQTHFQLLIGHLNLGLYGQLEQNKTHSLSSKKTESLPLFPLLDK